MNRAIWNIAEAPPPPSQLLPPPRRSSRDPMRVLFIQAAELGFLTASRSFEAATDTRDDIDAVHISGPLKGWARWLAAELPIELGDLDQQPYRYARVWGLLLRRICSTVLPPDRFDAIHIMPQQRGWIIPWLRRRTRAAITVNIDATIPAYFRAFDRPLPRFSLATGAERRALLNADMVACWSRWAANSAVKDVGVAPERITLHKPCVRIAPVRTAERGAGGPVRIAFVGNDFERKGGDRLLAWHKDRWSTRAELHVCSAKARPDRSLRGVVWHGATPHARLMGDILPACDLMVMPTREDTFLIAAQEAQAVGLPVVTSRLAGLPEVVRHDHTGYLFARDDDTSFIGAVDRLIADAGLRRSMSIAASEHAAANLDSATWYNHLLDQLIAVAQGRPPAFAPNGVDIRMSDNESNSPVSAADSAAAPACRL